MKKGTLLETLETILVVTVITMLIWLYAEGETVQIHERVITVRFVAPITKGLAITVPNQEPGTTEINVSATLQASSGDWDKIKEWVSSETIEIEVDTLASGVTDEQQTLNLLDALNNSSLAEVRAFVKEVSPPSVTVRVQKLVTVEMGLRVNPGKLKLTADAPTFFVDNIQIDKIEVELPTEYAKLAEDLKLIARVDKLDPDTLKEDTHNVCTVDLSLPPQLIDRPHVTLTRESLEVSFLVDKSNKEIELDRVQIRVSLSDDLTGDYDFKIDPDTQKFIPVTLEGPEEIIDRLAKDIKTQPDLVRASIIIKHSDIQGDGPHAAQLFIDVPQGVTVVSPDPSQTVTYSVTELPTQP